VFNRDVQHLHLHGAVAEEQPGRQVEVVTGEVFFFFDNNR
jgi:hypothetical protein